MINSIRNIDKTNSYIFMFHKKNILSAMLISSYTLLSVSVNIFIFYLFYDRLIASNAVDIKNQVHSDVWFKDIIGIEEFKEELENVVIQLKNRR